MGSSGGTRDLRVAIESPDRGEKIGLWFEQIRALSTTVEHRHRTIIPSESIFRHTLASRDFKHTRQDPSNLPSLFLPPFVVFEKHSDGC